MKLLKACNVFFNTRTDTHIYAHKQIRIYIRAHSHTHTYIRPYTRTYTQIYLYYQIKQHAIYICIGHTAGSHVLINEIFRYCG